MVKHLVLKNLFKALGGPCFSVERLVRSSAYCLLEATILVSLFPSRVMLGALETKMRELKAESELYIICNSQEDEKCNSGERFSDKRQSTPNVSNDFQRNLMICWNLLER